MDLASYMKQKARKIAIIMLLALGLSAEIAVAQNSTDLTVQAPSSLFLVPGRPTPLGIRISPAAPDKGVILISGLPADMSFSAGFRASPTSWLLPVNALAALNLTASGRFNAPIDTTIKLLTQDRRKLAETSLKLVSIDENAPATPISSQQTQNTAIKIGKPLSGEDLQRARRFVKKGDEAMQLGDISVARLFYKKAADIGLADAAFALARSYDAKQLAQMRVIGVEPDQAQAQEWYARARQLERQ